MLDTFLDTSIHKKVWNRLREHFRSEALGDRERREQQIPRVPLRREHAQHCELLLDRAVLLERLKKHGNVAEIGVDHSEFSDLILKIAQPARLHLVDTWGSDRYHDGLFRMISSKFSSLIDQERVQIHRKLSVDAASDFADDYFDWIYIDTDHSYETTRDELMRYAPKVVRNGIIAGHDYTMGNWVANYRYGVIEAVHEFCVTQGWELLYLTLEPTEHQSFAIRRIDQAAR